MHELAFGITNTNFAPFAGFAKNPFDQSRIPGGSSGGTAAAIAARIVPAGLGTDTGGSVRIPASFSGIAGLRPSTGGGRHRYSGAGVIPLSHTLDTVGPLGRTVADVALLDSVMTGASVPAPAPLQGLRIGIPAVLWGGLEREVDAVAQAARQRLADVGVVFVDVDMPDALLLAAKIIFPIALHEPIADLPKYLSDNGATGITVTTIASQIASPDVQKAFGAVVTDAEGGAYPELPAPIDAKNGSGTISVDGGPPVDTFSTTIRNMGPGSCAGVPSLSLPAGMERRWPSGRT